MSQIVLPFQRGRGNGPTRIIVGPPNAHVLEAFSAPESWPFRTAILSGPPRSGKSLLARWFAGQGRGEVIDNAEKVDETELFHRWNRAQEGGVPLLFITPAQGWNVSLPDLKSRIGAALNLEIGPPDDEMAHDLILAMAQERGLALGDDAAAYLVPRCERSFAALEQLVETIDRLSLERKQPATMAIWRAGLEAILGPEQHRLL